MVNKDTVFPQYRKLANGRAFYKITDDRHFEEVQLMGSRKIQYTVEAVQYPELLKIQDMLHLTTPGYELSDEQEWLTVK